MAKAAEIKTKLTGDATGLKRELASAKSEVTKYARDVTERLKAITAAVQSINIIAQVSAIVGIAKQGIELYNTLKNWINGAADAADEATQRSIDAARKLADAASKANLTTDMFAAVTEAASRANIPASELEKILGEIAKKGGGIQDVADALGTTADALERGAASARLVTIGRRYSGAAAERRGEYEAARENREADIVGYRQMARDLLSTTAGDLSRIVADVVRAANGDRRVMEYVMSEIMYERRNLRGIWRQATGGQRDVYTIHRALTQAFDTDAAARARAAEDAERARLSAIIAETVPEYNPYAAHAANERRQAAERAAAEKAAADIARRENRRAELLNQMGEASAKRAEDIAAITVSAPEAINSLNTIGGLIGTDPSKMNAMRMDEERNRKMDDITKKFDAANEKLQKAVDALMEG